MSTSLTVPIALRALALEVETALSVDEIHSPMGQREARVNGEILQFPYRTCYKTDLHKSLTESASGEAKAICLCLGTRHHDGRVREESLRSLEPTAYAWTIPFAIQLLGEYVVEIAKIVEMKIQTSGVAEFAAFAKENTDFVSTTRQRAVSYWDCYYRASYPSVENYPGFRAINSIQAAM